MTLSVRAALHMAVRIVVGVTDRDWFAHLRARPARVRHRPFHRPQADLDPLLGLRAGFIPATRGKGAPGGERDRAVGFIPATRGKGIRSAPAPLPQGYIPATRGKG